MPGDMLSYVAGLTTVSWKAYTVATFFGFLPQSIMYAWVGAEATEWFWAMMLIGTIVSAALAAGAIVYGWILRSMRRRALATMPVRNEDSREVMGHAIIPTNVTQSMWGTSAWRR